MIFRLLALVKEASSSITLEDVMKKRVVPSTHSHSSKAIVDKNIALGKVEAAVEVHVMDSFKAIMDFTRFLIIYI